MSEKQLFIGNNTITQQKEGGTGSFVKINEETWIKISGVDDMDPFFMTVVSSTNQWMFIASNGALTAGRINPESALFPYYTDDKIVDAADITGSKTIFKVLMQGIWKLWEPFSDRYLGVYNITRHVYKNKLGNKLRFEEINHDLELTFHYTWSFSNAWGFVKTAQLSNQGNQDLQIELLDGLQNLLPAGVNSGLQGTRSTLVDAYKKNELEKNSGLGIFSLSAMIVDKAEPSESLKATTVWSQGLPEPTYLLSSKQLNQFRRGQKIQEETFTKACKAAYFVQSNIVLMAGSSLDWLQVAEVNQSTAAVVNLAATLQKETNLMDSIVGDVQHCSAQLEKLVGLADGIQKGRDKLSTNRHFSNVLFNIMRGGVFENQYKLVVADLKNYMIAANPKLAIQHADFLNTLVEPLTYRDLLEKAAHQNDAHLIRLCTEYLPLTFSRRHGDPSRPWNSFNIELQDADGNKKFYYEGNWRDIFQNWEALAYAFPEFIEGMIAKFLNASTIDGYNPYRITSKGIDWEVIEEHDPWSFIGYWGDHQIIYLQKLLEHAAAHYPKLLSKLIEKQQFVYANVPYRIKSYADIKANPNDTIDFDHHLEAEIAKRCKTFGMDGKLVLRNNQLLRANLAEKLLVTGLTKLYNFVPDGGIWLNTQRPEWNDANNALVGNGLSMVTLNYLYRYLEFLDKLFADFDGDAVELNQPVAELFDALAKIYSNRPVAFDAPTRAAFVDALGSAGEKYRTAAYSFFDGATTVKQSIKEILNFVQHAKEAIAKTLIGSKRPDGLYHAYNLLLFDDKGCHIEYLYEMLEGQVAALSAGLLAPEEAVNVLDALKSSAMFRPDQYSYMLYPDRELAPFISKNTIPQQFVKQSELFPLLVARNNRSLVEQNAAGGYHFAGGLHNAAGVKQVLKNLEQTDLQQLAKRETNLILEAFEAVFNHVAFTGRSGTFYGYEGLGCIYWHMVSKLLLAVQENISAAKELGASEETVGRLIAHYFEIRAGIGINKSPKLYGAFPTDAYSHTPGNAGAQQPGLTGQVKEDILSRWAELGVRVKNGCIQLNPFFLNPEELLQKDETMAYIGVDERLHRQVVAPHQMAFTYCNTLFVYENAPKPVLTVVMRDGTEQIMDDLTIPSELSAAIFARTGQVQTVRLYYPILK